HHADAPDPAPRCARAGSPHPRDPRAAGRGPQQRRRTGAPGAHAPGRPGPRGDPGPGPAHGGRGHRDPLRAPIGQRPRCPDRVHPGPGRAPPLRAARPGRRAAVPQSPARTLISMWPRARGSRKPLPVPWSRRARSGRPRGESHGSNRGRSARGPRFLRTSLGVRAMSVTAGVRRRRRRSGAVSTAVLAVIALVITGFAVDFDGLSSSEVEGSDGGVWVLNEGGGLLGRLNVDAHELDARLSMTGDDLDVLQSGYNVIETGSRGMTPINAASVRRGGLVELPPGSEVALGGDRVAIAAPDGRVWLLTPGEAAAFSTAGVEPAHTSASVPPRAASAQRTFVVWADTERHDCPVPADPRAPEADQTIEVGGLPTTDETLELTTGGEEPVTLHRENRMLRRGTEVKDY